LTLALPALSQAQLTPGQSPYQTGGAQLPAAVPPATVPTPVVTPSAPGITEQQPVSTSAESPAMRAVTGEALSQMEKKEAEAKKAAEDAKAKELEEKGFRVGSALNMTVRWNTASGLTGETPNKDFVVHLGGRFQFDNVWFDQSPNSRAGSQMGN